MNENMPVDEISDIVKNFNNILSDTNINLYLDGLVKIRKNSKVESFKIRSQISQGKKGDVTDYQYSILKDPSEYWRLIFDEGILHFLTDTYDERINEIEDNEPQKQSKLLQLQSKIALFKEQYSKIKNSINNLTNILKKYEQQYRNKKSFFYFDEQFKIIYNVNDITSNLKPIANKEISLESVRQNNKIENDFKKCLRIFLMRNRLNIKDFCDNLVDVKKNLKIQNTKPILKDVIFSIINRDKNYVENEQIIAFLSEECKIKNVLQKQNISYSDDKEEETDFQDENITLVVKYLLKNFDSFKEQFDIQDENNAEDIFVEINSDNRSTNEIDLNSLRDLLKLKLVILSEKNLKTMRDILDCEEAPDSPFKHYKEQTRIMEEVYITQILFELIKNPDTDLLLEDDDDDQDPIHIKNLTESITQFIDSTKQIFTDQTVNQQLEFKMNQILIFILINNKIYLIKFVRLLLETKQINLDTIENKNSKDKQATRKATKQVYDYKLMQTIVGKSKIHEPVFSKIISSNYQSETIESLVLIVQLLNFGSSENQASILDYFKSEKDICLDFFSSLNDFFTSKSSYNLIQIKESRRKVPSQTVYFEVHSFLILKILQLFCENVNEDFQSFLRQQNDASDIYSASTNIVLETSNFLSFLLEDHTVSIDCKNKLICQCLETLVDFSTGAGENQQLICSNKRLFSFLQDKILDMNVNFEKPKFTDSKYVIKKQENKIELFISCSKFLLSMVEGNTNTESLRHILQHIQCDKMLSLIYKIYKERISPLQKNLVLEIQCYGDNTKKHVNCNDSICISGYCTDYDIYLYEIGFKIFIIFLYLMEQFPEDHILDPFTQLLDKKEREFDIFDFNGEESIKKDFFKKFNRQLRDQKKQQPQLKIQQQLGSSQQNNMQGQNFMSQSHENAILRNTLIENVQTKKELKSILQIFSKKHKGERHNISFDVNFNRVFSKEQQNQVNQNILNELKQGQSRSTSLNKMQTIAKQEDDDHVEISLNQRPKNLFKILLESIQDNEIMVLNPRYFDFYKNQVGITEIFINEEVKLIYFQKPFCSNFLSPYIKNHLIYESNRESDEDRLLFMLDNFMFYYKQMIYKQYWYQHKISWFMESWRTIKDIQYFFLLLIVFLQLFFLEGSIGDDSGESDLDNLTRAFTVIQLILTAVVLIFCGIERFKISINRFTNADSWRKIQYLKENAGLTTETILSKIQKFMSAFEDNLNPTHYKKFSFASRVFIYIFLIASDIENFYHACYLGITIAGFFSKGPLVYGILLLDIVKRSASLKQIIKSITQNLWNIFIFSYLGVIVMYIYGIGAYYYFKKDFLPDEKVYNNTFVVSVASVINMGLRNGGGISESLKNIPSYTDDENHISSSYYWGRYFYDLSFFILINMLFIQIIFGIILDTFEELRKEQDEINEEVLNKCFVCSMSRGYIDSNSTEGGWYQHIYLQHNAYHLVFFLICIARKDDTECNYIETYVKKQINQKLVEFIPSLMSSDIPEKEEVGDA